MSELISTTGLSSSSLYHRFGDKDGVFVAAINRYADLGLTERIVRLKELPDPLEAITRFFEEIVELSTCDSDHLGCLLVNSALDGGSMSQEARHLVATRLDEIESFFHDRLIQAKAQGLVDQTIIPERHAEELMATILAMRVLARLNPDPARLRRLAATTIAGIRSPIEPT